MEHSFFTRKNIVLLIAGMLTLVVGFFCLAQGPATNPVSLTLAPVLLTLAYMVIIPWGILAGSREQKQQPEK